MPVRSRKRRRSERHTPKDALRDCALAMVSDDMKSELAGIRGDAAYVERLLKILEDDFPKIIGGCQGWLEPSSQDRAYLVHDERNGRVKLTVPSSRTFIDNKGQLHLNCAQYATVV